MPKQIPLSSLPLFAADWWQLLELLCEGDTADELLLSDNPFLEPIDESSSQSALGIAGFTAFAMVFTTRAVREVAGDEMRTTLEHPAHGLLTFKWTVDPTGGILVRFEMHWCNHLILAATSVEEGMRVEWTPRAGLDTTSSFTELKQIAIERRLGSID